MALAMSPPRVAASRHLATWRHVSRPRAFGRQVAFDELAHVSLTEQQAAAPRASISFVGITLLPNSLKFCEPLRGVIRPKFQGLLIPVAGLRNIGLDAIGPKLR